MRKPTSYEGCEIDAEGNVTDIFFHSEVLAEGNAEERAHTRRLLARRGYSAEVIEKVMGPEPSN
jgi:hypothetical protein